MKNIYKILFFSFLLNLLPGTSQAQSSSIVTYSPSNSTMFGSASRVGCHTNNWTNFYMRYYDSSYFCSLMDGTLIYTTSSAYKMPLKQDFIITDFKKLKYKQGFIGSYQGVGMHGWAYDYMLIPPNTNSLIIFKLPVVDNLSRMATIKTSDPNISFQTKAFAIGKGANFSDAPPRNYILEFYAEGVGTLTPYCYIPMPYDLSTGGREIANDVITIDHYVVFATRDSRINHAPVNLRISDTNNALSSMDISFQWQFLLPSYEQVVSELRLLPLDDKYFVLTYNIFNTLDNTYYLCIHRIQLAGLLAGNNIIVSHEIKIDGNCKELVDIVYDPDVNTLVILMNGNEKSEIYHDNPFSNANSNVSKLLFSDGCLVSLDTMGEFYHSIPDWYMALGDSVFFCQNISTGAMIAESCLDIVNVISYLRESPQIALIEDPLDYFFDRKSVVLFDVLNEYFGGYEKCVLPDK